MDLRAVWSGMPSLLDGVILTAELTLLAAVMGLCVAVPLAVMRLARHPAISLPAHGFIFFFRGTPLLVQLFLVYYGSGQFVTELRAIGLWALFREPFFCGALTLTLNTAAYTAEILRGAIQGVPHGDIEAARACGMSRLLLYRRIILPKAFRLAWPAYTNELVLLLQSTSLVSIITLMDITGQAGSLAAESFAFYEFYLSAAVLYLMLVYGAIFVFRRIEWRISAHMREAPIPLTRAAASGAAATR
jgi:His/Glu/Gln/Arg/opine family amino acid ABC transporter permease subunit